MCSRGFQFWKPKIGLTNTNFFPGMQWKHQCWYAPDISGCVLQHVQLFSWFFLIFLYFISLQCSEPKLFWWNCTKTKFPPSRPLPSQFLRNPSRTSIPYQISLCPSFRRMYRELENGNIDWITPFFPGHYQFGTGSLTSAEPHYIPRMLPNLLNTFSH